VARLCRSSIQVSSPQRLMTGPPAAICGQVADTGKPAHCPGVLLACENQVAESTRYSLFHLAEAR
jgi:hypothetical protein